MNVQKLLIDEIRSYLLIYKTTCIFYDIGIDLQTDYDNVPSQRINVANYLYGGLDNILHIIDDIEEIDSDDDDFLSTLQEVSINNDIYTDDLIIKEVINKFNKRPFFSKD